jgi:hypothetical protein
MPDKKFISMGEAVRRVGQARFREKWIGGLTDEECEAAVRWISQVNMRPRNGKSTG